MRINYKKTAVATIVISSVLVIFAISSFWMYLKVIPSAVSNENVINTIEKFVKDSFDADLTVKNPILITDMSPEITFKTDEISLKKAQKQLLLIKKINTTISLAKIFQKTIILKRADVESVFADVNEIMSLAQKEPENKEEMNFDWNIEWLDSLLNLKNLLVLYDLDENTNIKITGKNLQITETREPKFVHFDMNIDIVKGKDKIKLSVADKNDVFIKDHKLFLENAILGVNNSKVFIRAVSDEKSNFELDVFSHNFDLKNVVEILDSDLIIPNGDEMLAYYKDINGLFNFNINVTNKAMKGIINVNKAGLKLIPLNNMPVNIQHGYIEFDEKDITLKDFKGYYGTAKAENKFEFFGTVKDYTKSVDTNIEATGIMTNDFMKNYLSPVAGTKLTLTGPSKARAYIKSKYNKMDITAMGRIATGDDILIEGMSLSPVTYDRALVADFHLEGNDLDIKQIRYFIAKEISEKSSKDIKPILTVDGKMDINTLEISKLGFDIPNPLPSEFLNLFVGQHLFQKGTISGHMYMVTENKKPRLDGTLEMSKVLIPSQRLSIRDGKLTTDKNLVKIDANGRFKRSNWEFNGFVKNSLLLPIEIKDINLTLDDIDIEKLLTSLSQQPNQQEKEAQPLISVIAEEETVNSDTSDEAPYVFNTGFLIVDKCLLELKKGKYKELLFGNLKANLTLDKNGILQIVSNKFDFAEGISTLKIYCDLIKHQYSIRLGVKDINSDLIAGTLLALPKEISGKAKGLIELNTDDSLKLNGKLQFRIEDGAIQKVGLVEYALKFASLFRNPMTMISPSTIIDLVNVPDGNFEWIQGDIYLKDNVAERIMIKSASPQLSSFIIGRYEIMTGDAALRIYTKFSNKHKGLSGVLRNISLNSLANKVPLGRSNESLYYSAELEQLPDLEANDKDCQVFLTKVDGDVANFNFLSSLKKIK